MTFQRQPFRLALQDDFLHPLKADYLLGNRLSKVKKNAFLSQKAGKKIKKASERYPEDSDDSSKEETGNKSRPDRIDLGISFEDESVAAKHDDLLILKKRNIHLEDLGLQPPEKVSFTARPKTRDVFLYCCVT